MKKNKEKMFLIINILFPLIAGAITYYLISPDVFFVKGIDTFLGNGIHINMTDSNFWTVRLIRNYVLDMMWGYALVFALYFIIGNNTAELMKIFIIAIVFSSVMEILQLTPIAKGTFDIFDIIVEFLAEVAAVIIIKTFTLGGN